MQKKDKEKGSLPAEQSSLTRRDFIKTVGLVLPSIAVLGLGSLVEGASAVQGTEAGSKPVAPNPPAGEKESPNLGGSGCNWACAGACSGQCGGGCSFGCDSTCRGSCSTSCTGTCQNSCHGSCQDNCSSSCSGTCTRSCTGMLR
ncbi:MAG: hypothetical protein P4N59_28885 [Negativicutes bacterium]|nr:hypothetical protein [Negativicutes bacterium]